MIAVCLLQTTRHLNTGVIAAAALVAPKQRTQHSAELQGVVARVRHTPIVPKLKGEERLEQLLWGTEHEGPIERDLHFQRTFLAPVLRSSMPPMVRCTSR